MELQINNGPTYKIESFTENFFVDTLTYQVVFKAEYEAKELHEALTVTDPVSLAILRDSLPGVYISEAHFGSLQRQITESGELLIANLTEEPYHGTDVGTITEELL